MTGVIVTEGSQNEPASTKPILSLTPVEQAIMRIDGFISGNLLGRNAISVSETTDFLLDLRNDVAKLRET